MQLYCFNRDVRFGKRWLLCHLAVLDKKVYEFQDQIEGNSGFAAEGAAETLLALVAGFEFPHRQQNFFH